MRPDETHPGSQAMGSSTPGLAETRLCLVFLIYCLCQAGSGKVAYVTS
jgi:hypothetical protein